MFRFIKRIMKYILYFIMFLIMVVALIYSISPVYDFEEASTFSGEHIYNPYDGLNSNAWLKGNFQVQSHAWYGTTNGRKNSNDLIFETYEKLGYDIIAISDYQKINTFKKKDRPFLRVYEHGYGIFKNHQVCIGSNKVLWLDYPFYQTSSNKQHVLNNLRDNNTIVAIAHPGLRHAYSASDMEKLCNYDCIEVQNNYIKSLDLWDAALSSGKVAYILANDDAHDVSNPYEVGRNCTFINSDTNAANIANAIKKGRAFGAEILLKKGQIIGENTITHENIPCLTSVEVVDDTMLQVCINAPAVSFEFYGQDGKLLLWIPDTNCGHYHIKATDTYVRTVIYFEDGSRFFLNPVFRYDGNKIPERTATINTTKTLFSRMIFLLLAISLAAIIYKRRKQKHTR